MLDARGCELASKVTFRLAPESTTLATTVLVDINGRVKVRADAEPAIVALVVEGASKTARVELEVVSDQRYSELLGTPGLDDGGVDDQAVSVVVSGGVGSTPTILGDPQADEGARKHFAWLAIVGGVCTLLTLFGVVLWRRGAPPPPSKRGRRTIGARARRLEAEAGRERANVARRSPVHLAIPRDAVGVDVASPGSAAAGASVGVGSGLAPSPGVQTHGRACPMCGQVFPTDAGFCPHDGSALIPTAAEVSPPRPSAAVEGNAPGRICPVCGKRYAPAALFCGSDGVELVPLN
jgi:predicted nucleic acid-binding Zn ribbon protein